MNAFKQQLLAIICSVLVLMMAACNLTSPQTVPTIPAVNEPPVLPEQAPDQEQTDSPTPQSNADGGDSSPADEAITQGVDLASCPSPESFLLLKFSAVIKVDAEESSIQHILDDGVLNLHVTQSDGASSVLEGVESPTIPYSMQGTMGECTLSGSGQMTPSAHGFCENGIVYMIIIEDWGAYSGELTCPDEDGDVVAPVNAPAMGVMTHTGADGRGEVFYLDKNFSEAGVGYTLFKPFQGQGGSGEHIWTIFWEWGPGE